MRSSRQGWGGQVQPPGGGGQVSQLMGGVSILRPLAGGMPLAFTQEDFLVTLLFHNVRCSVGLCIPGSDGHQSRRSAGCCSRTSHAEGFLQSSVAVPGCISCWITRRRCSLTFTSACKILLACTHGTHRSRTVNLWQRY